MAEIRADMVANVWQIGVAVGDQVMAGQEVAILESMKMEIPVVSPVAGVVTSLHVAPDDTVQEGDLIVVVE